MELRPSSGLTGVVPSRGPDDGDVRLPRGLSVSPPLRRASMAPAPPGRARDAIPVSGPHDPGGTIRRAILLVLVLGQTAVGADLLKAVLPYHGERPLELATLVLSTVLLTWVSWGFWTAVAGFFALATARGDRLAIGRTLARDAEIPGGARTAVVMPIRNEHVARVFAGLRAVYLSIARTGALERFDFYVLSDSSDPDARAAETAAWFQLCRDAGAFGRIYYRWRRHRIKGKSGNISDFCRRWGSQYRYMVVLDADSVMSGECLTSLVRLMEANPTAGIIQTAPRPARRGSPFGRMQQFAMRVYGPLFAAGISYWHLGEAYYWGHNAIIRIAPFMRHCALGRLPGRGTLSGEILSHDFVEAALMRRAGWRVWIAYDLPGSWEEVPATLDDELRRDWRWCRGNLINARFCMARGMHPAHRAVFVGGAMAYVSAPLWLLSLGLSTASVAVRTLVGPQYFLRPRQLFPIWPEWHQGWAVGLLLATTALLLIPKVLGTALALARGAREFGGPGRLVLSAAIEAVGAALMAPVRMVFHALYVVAALLGLHTEWRSPGRDDAETTWPRALRRYWAPTVLGIGWAAGVRGIAPDLLWWILPVAGALASSIPLAVYSSRSSLGHRLRRARIFAIPEETRPPMELRFMRRWLARCERPVGFAQLVFDPSLNALACASARTHVRARARPLGAARQRLLDAGLEGPLALGPSERLRLLGDPVVLSELHRTVRASPAAAALWRAEVDARRR